MKGRAKRRARFTRRTEIDLTGLDHRQARRVMRRAAGWFAFYDEFYVDPVEQFPELAFMRGERVFGGPNNTKEAP